MNILTVNLLYGSVVSANGSAPSFADRVIRLPAAGVGSVETPFKRAMRVIEKQREILESQREKREKRGHSTPPATFLFPCRHVGKQKPMTVYALDQEAQRVSQELGIPRFTPHDLRRTCSTKLGEMLVPGHIIDRIANHKPIGITDRVYNKYDYLKEKQEALNSWGTRLSVIVSDLELVKAENTEI